MSSAIYSLGRVMIAAIFLYSGFKKATGFSATVELMASKGIPFTEVLAVGTIAFEVLGGLMVAIGYRPRLGALLLIVFLIPTTLLFHPPGDPAQLISFWKNLAILGGLALVLGSPAGKRKEK